MSSSDSPNDLDSDTLEFVEWSLVGIAVTCTLYGASVIMAGVSAYFLINEHKKVHRSRKFLLIIIAIMFFCDTAFIILLLGGLIDMAHNNVEQFLGFGVACGVFVKLNYLLSDIVVVWRAWTLASTRYPRARYLLPICLGASTLAVISSIVVDSVGAFQSDDSPLNTSIPLAVSLPLTLFTTNVVATSFIGKIAWESRHTMSLTYKGSNNKQFRYMGRIMIHMLESGFIYSFIWLLILINNMFDDLTFTTVMLAATVPQITSLYPTIVVFLNATHRSVYSDRDAEEDSDSTYIPLTSPGGERTATKESFISSDAPLLFRRE